MLLRCLDEKEAKKVMKKMHEILCATHNNRNMLTWQIQISGYFWTIMENNCNNYEWKCQVFVDKIYWMLVSLHNMTIPWSFVMWGLDVIGLINPRVRNENWFILVGIYYFTKWTKVASYTYVTQKVVQRFIEKDIICQYNLLELIVINFF
jgi:hypothetical protein